MNSVFVPAAAIAAAPLSVPAAPQPETAVALLAAAGLLLADLERGRAIDAQALRAAMIAALGGSDAEGAWSWKTAYDACEAAQILFLRKFGPAMRGPLALYLGMLAGALEDHAAAEQHFDEALTISEGLHAPYWAARTQFERAKMLCERGRTDDQARSASLVAGVREMAQARGFAALDRRAAELV